MNAREDASTTFLFTDIEGSSRLWEQDPERMGAALAAHNAIARETVERHGGTIVKMTGDGVYAAFTDSVQAVNATVQLQHALTAPCRTASSCAFAAVCTPESPSITTAISSVLP